MRSIAMSVSLCVHVCPLSYHKKTSKLHNIFCTCYPWPWLNWSSFGDNAVCCVLSGFVDDVMFAQNRWPKGNASRVYSQSNSVTHQGGQHRGKVLCLWLPCFELIENLYFTTVGSAQYKQYNNRIREEKTYIYKNLITLNTNTSLSYRTIGLN